VSIGFYLFLIIFARGREKSKIKWKEEE